VPARCYPLLQRRYRAPRHNGSAIGCKVTTQTSCPQLVNALGLTQFSKDASSPYVDLTVRFPSNERHHEPKAIIMAGASFLSAAAPCGTVAHSAVCSSRVYPGCVQGYVHVFTPLFTAFYCSKRPESTFYIFYRTAFTPVLRRFCSVFLHRLLSFTSVL